MFYRMIHSKQDNTAFKHKDFHMKIHSKQENTALKHKDFVHEDSLQARQHSIEIQGFYRKIHSKQDNTALKHKDFTVRFTPSKTTQH